MSTSSRSAVAPRRRHARRYRHSLRGGRAEQPFGAHIAYCAQMSLGQRQAAPQVTCTHDGMMMTFPDFGAMVLHMRAER